MLTMIRAQILVLLLIPSASSAQESFVLPKSEMLELCERIASLGHYIAGVGEAGGDVEQKTVEMSMQILGDSDAGLLPKPVAAKMVASLNLGALGLGTPDDIGYFVFNNCMNTGWVRAE